MKKHFLTGLVILLPIAITIALISYLVNFFTTPFVDFVCAFLERFPTAANALPIRIASKLIILICLFFFIVGLGMLTRWFVVRAVVTLGDRILHKIPVINTVYKATKEIIGSLFSSDTVAFKQVVLVPFPQKNMWALGLITGSAPVTNSRLISVLIPTTPSPISGFLVMYDPADLIYLKMKPEDAIKYIISCGVLTPQEARLR